MAELAEQTPILQIILHGFWVLTYMESLNERSLH